VCNSTGNNTGGAPSCIPNSTVALAAGRFTSTKKGWPCHYGKISRYFDIRSSVIAAIAAKERVVLDS